MKGKALMLIRTMIVLVALGAVVAPGTPAQATSHGLATTTIKVIAGNSSFKLSAKTAKRGVVIFKVRNAASYRHDFSIKGRTTPVLLTGQSATLRVTFLRPGRYPYRCTVVPHYRWGQKGVFTIT